MCKVATVKISGGLTTTMAKYDDHAVSFSGTENVHAFFMQFENAVALKSIPNDKKVLALINKLNGPALLWCSTLPPDIRADYDLLKKAVHDRFAGEHLKLLHKCDLFQIRQMAGQTVDDFNDVVSLKCVQLEVVGDLKLTCLLNGLHPDIKQFVLAREPKDADEVVKYGRLAETTGLGSKSKAVAHDCNVVDPDFQPVVDAVGRGFSRSFSRGPWPQGGFSRSFSRGPWPRGQPTEKRPFQNNSTAQWSQPAFNTRPPVRCFRCSRLNHVQKYCTEWNDVYGNPLN